MTVTAPPAPARRGPPRPPPPPRSPHDHSPPRTSRDVHQAKRSAASAGGGLSVGFFCFRFSSADHDRSVGSGSYERGTPESGQKRKCCQLAKTKDHGRKVVRGIACSPPTYNAQGLEHAIPHNAHPRRVVEKPRRLIQSTRCRPGTLCIWLAFAYRRARSDPNTRGGLSEPGRAVSVSVVCFQQAPVYCDHIS